MKCFYNPAEDAIGTCKSCGKGLSFAYATEFPKGLACKGKCEEEVQRIIAMIEDSISMRRTSHTLVRGVPSGLYASFTLYIIMAGAFVWMGTRHEGLSPVTFIGLAFAGFAVFVLIRGLKLSWSLGKTSQEAPPKE